MNWFLLGLRYKLSDLFVRLRFELRWWVRRQWFIEKVVQDPDSKKWIILWRDSVTRNQRTTTKPASYYGRD